METIVILLAIAAVVAGGYYLYRRRNTRHGGLPGDSGRPGTRPPRRPK